MIQEVLHSFRDLVVWQKAMDLVVSIYELTREFPSQEQYGLISQMRRSAVSIPSNLAEGRRRSTRNDFLHFVFIAYASGAELETQLELSRRLGFCSKEQFDQTSQLLDSVMKMLNRLTLSLKPNKPTS
ncbi:MAG: four helix bundle protein [Candidatus Peribacteraceae bacterium]|nr:four helix bundle protein [Candidatus Peribacteraceae bacterium]MDD5739443.1 four helix bundle protein [Candidatus Peribacteraceae bacterium]